jgi:hypothetical protein
MIATKGWAWTFVQGSSSTENSCGSAVTTFTVTAGDLMVMGCFNGVNSADSVTDNNGNTWVIAGSTGVSNGTVGSGFTMNILYVASAIGGVEHPLVNTAGCNGNSLCVVLEYSGQATSSPFDVFSGSAPIANSLANITSNAATSSVSNDLFVAFVDTNTGGSFTVQSGNARTMAPQASNTVNSQDSPVASPSAFTSTWTQSPGSFQWVAAQAAFKPSGGASSGFNKRSRIERAEE